MRRSNRHTHAARCLKTVEHRFQECLPRNIVLLGQSKCSGDRYTTGVHNGCPVNVVDFKNMGERPHQERPSTGIAIPANRPLGQATPWIAVPSGDCIGDRIQREKRGFLQIVRRNRLFVDKPDQALGKCRPISHASDQAAL